ncbi:helix-turn-helix domain-containing protein [Aureimonas psammosilenae]|uniref:helix-turn-helix domain-containing protein n=1 Tax=Aureimonas psammosilenae TaxID=2495496 RepID=UPI0012610F78|nr:helix-turn-helix transcriptional regulator [Aureimonas psammosilenae]
MIDLQLAARLKQAREVRYSTAQEACDAFGFKYPTYAGHENGTRGFKKETARIYAAKFRVGLEWLLTGKGDIQTSAETDEEKHFLSEFRQLEAADKENIQRTVRGLIALQRARQPSDV